MTAMNPTLNSVPTQRRRGRLQLLLILAVVIGPMLLASAMYRFGFWLPDTRSYDGALVADGQGRDALGVTVPATAEPRFGDRPIRSGRMAYGRLAPLRRALPNYEQHMKGAFRIDSAGCA